MKPEWFIAVTCKLFTMDIKYKFCISRLFRILRGELIRILYREQMTVISSVNGVYYMRHLL